MSDIGVFLCTCDGKINMGIGVEAVARRIATGTNRETVIVPHACLPDGRRELENTIREKGLARVVIAACPARLQEKRLRETCLRAGLDGDYCALVDWREGCANPHRGDKTAATEKAGDLVEMGIARVMNATGHNPAQARIVPRVLIIGGGIAGMTAARGLAERGIAVTLVERRGELGGQLARTSLNGAPEKFQAFKRHVLSHPRLALYLNSRLKRVSGEVGKYEVEIAYPDGATRAQVGAIVVATGAHELRDPQLYHYDGRRVVTLSEFQSQISNLHPPISLVFILCAGSRDARIPYCSKTCCLASLHQAIRVKREHPQADIVILFRDLYLRGDELNEQVVLDARKLGIEFIRYASNDPPRVEQDGVTVREYSTGLTRQIACDRVVLATPQVAQDDAGMLARWLHLPRDENGFFIDPHYRVRPEQQAERGIFICGSAHQPVDNETAALQGLTAAARAARFIQRGEVIHASASARVDLKLCTGCAQCIETCAFSAIEIFESPFHRARIDPFLCLACGNCLAACPAKAITLPGAEDAQILAQIDAALEHKRGEESRILVFGCTWSGYAAMELAGARRMAYSARVRTIELPCSARLDPMHVLYALLNGADRVLLALCPPDECHYGNGNRYAEMRIEKLRAALAAHGIDPARVSLARILADDAEAWTRAVSRVTA